MRGSKRCRFENQALIESSNSHMLKNTSTGHYLWHPDFTKVWGKKPQISLHNLRHSKFYELLVSRYIMDWYAVTAFHGQIIPSQIVPQCCQNFSAVFQLRAEVRALLLCIPRSLSQKSIFHIRFSTATVEQSDYKMKRSDHGTWL